MRLMTGERTCMPSTSATGKLVEHSLDGIDPVFGPNSVEHPVVIWYKWDGKAFIMDHMKVEGPFPTSYDCSKATGEVERAICYSPRISALDVQLAQTYEAAWQQATSEERKTLEQQQRQWLAERKKECTIYKWWVDCLNDLYTKRILELKEH